MRVFHATLDKHEHQGQPGWRWLVGLGKDLAHTGWAPTLFEAVEGTKEAIAQFHPGEPEKISIDITIKDES